MSRHHSMFYTWPESPLRVYFGFFVIFCWWMTQMWFSLAHYFNRLLYLQFSVFLYLLFSIIKGIMMTKPMFGCTDPRQMWETDWREWKDFSYTLMHFIFSIQFFIGFTTISVESGYVYGYVWNSLGLCNMEACHGVRYYRLTWLYFFFFFLKNQVKVKASNTIHKAFEEC